MTSWMEIAIALVGRAQSPLLPELVLQLEREYMASVKTVEGDAVTLRIGNVELAARAQVPLQPGDELRVRVQRAAGGQVQLKLVGDGAPPAQAPPPRSQTEQQVRAALAPLVGEARADEVAAHLAARGAPPGEAAVTAAKALAGAESPLADLRRLAEGKPALQALLQKAEQAAVAGDGRQLRQALTTLGLDHERQLVASAALAGAREPTLKDGLAREDARLVSAQQLLVDEPQAASLLSVPLPRGGEAKVTLEAGGRGERLDAFRLSLELNLEQLGTVGVRLVGHQGAVFVSVESADPEVAAQLRAAHGPLEETLRETTGRPVRVAVREREPEPVQLPLRAAGAVDLVA